MNALVRASSNCNDRPTLSSERMLCKDYDRRYSIGKKNSGRESQGARRQYELIGSKLPLTLTLTDSESTSKDIKCD
jgi:hypothetical protein